jgi:hypothetical protein
VKHVFVSLSQNFPFLQVHLFESTPAKSASALHKTQFPELFTLLAKQLTYSTHSPEADTSLPSFEH